MKNVPASDRTWNRLIFEMLAALQRTRMLKQLIEPREKGSVLEFAVQECRSQRFGEVENTAPTSLT